ncbi:hypothetical protein C8R43DRAFT_1039992 [Mycena crocata]|nr:hypothetical protein C8R43DRAFT_1039992 [Mycena crocata]
MIFYLSRPGDFCSFPSLLMSTTDTAPFELSDRPLATKLISELKMIAREMKLDDSLTKDALRSSIQRHLTANAALLAENPRFLPLVAHRTNPKSGGKNSIEKSAEDAVEASKPTKAATGAHRALLENRIKTDPRPQFSKLSLGGENHKTDSTVLPSDEDSEDAESIKSARAASPELDTMNQKAISTQDLAGLVQVNIYDEHNHKVLLRQVLVDEFPVGVSTSRDGDRKYTTLLSKLIPAVIKNDSPIKELGGRMYRPNIGTDSAHHHLGKVEALLAGTSSALGASRLDEYTLQPAGDGSFLSDLFWDQKSGNVISADSANNPFLVADDTTLPAQANNQAGLPPLTNRVSPPTATGVAPNSVQPVNIGPQFTGAGTDIPLAIANTRAQQNPMHRDAAPGLLDNFARYLHGLVRAEVTDIPEYGIDWARCNFAGQMRERHVKQEKCFEFFEPWSRAAGGYTVPQGFQYAGTRFKKDFIYDVLAIRSSSTSDIEKYFTSDMLEAAPKVREWVESDGVTNNNKFHKMKSARFKEYMTDHQRRASRGEGSSRSRVRRRNSSTSPNNRARKHKKKSARESASSGDEDRRGSKGKGKGRAVDSDDLDA